MHPYKPFDITFYLDQPFGRLDKGENTFQVDNLKSVMEFIFSINPEQFIAPIKGISGLYFNGSITFSQEGQEIGSLYHVPGTRPEVEDPGLYLQLEVPSEKIVGITANYLDALPIISTRPECIQLARYHNDLGVFQWCPGYMLVRAETQMTQGNESIHENGHRAMVHEVSQKREASDWKEYSVRSFWPTIEHAHHYALNTNFELFDPIANIMYPSEERDFYFQAISIHTDNMMDDDVLFHYIPIEDVGSDNCGIVPGIYFQLNTEKFPSYQDFDKEYQWNFENWKYEKLSDEQFLVAEEIYNRGRIIEQDPYLRELAAQKAVHLDAAPFHVEVQGQLPSRDPHTDILYLTDRYYFTSIFPAIKHLFSLNIGVMDRSITGFIRDAYHINKAAVYYKDQKVLGIDVLADINNQMKPGERTVYISKYGELTGIGLLPVSINGGLLPHRLKIGVYDVDSKIFQPSNDFLTIQDHYRQHKRYTSDTKHVEYIQSKFLQEQQSVFIVEFKGRLEINANDSVKCKDFDEAYTMLADLPAQALESTSKGGYERVSIIDPQGNLLVTRFEHGGDRIIPKGVYTMIHSDNITPEVLGGISKDLTIVDNKSEYFLCRSLDGEKVSIQKQPSPLRIRLPKQGGGYSL